MVAPRVSRASQGGIMSQKKPAPFGSIKSAKMLGSKPFLPADMMCLAQSSRRMQEMVYDDTRWVQKLRLMDLWVEAEARKRFEETMRRKIEAQKNREAEESRRTGNGMPGRNKEVSTNGSTSLRDRQSSITLFDVGVEERKQKRVEERARLQDDNGPSTGFEDISLQHSDDTNGIRLAQADSSGVLHILEKVRSVRGWARQEYGKIYGALGPFYFDLVNSKNNADPVLFRIFRDPGDQAKMLHQLRIFAKSDIAQGSASREERLEAMIAIFENAVLREFEHGYEARDIDGKMHKYAHVLVTLNGGAAAVDLYIHNNQLLSEKEQFGNPQDCINELLRGRLALDTSSAFFKQLAITVNEEIRDIDRVFPSGVHVLIPLLERVAEEVILEYITPVLDEAHRENMEHYLKLMAGMFQQSRYFVQSLQSAHEEREVFEKSVTSIIDRAFEPHIDLFLQEELDEFKRKALAEVDIWEKKLSEQEASAESFYMSNVNRQAVKQDFLTSFKKVLMMPVSVLPSMQAPTIIKADATGSASTDVIVVGAQDLSLSNGTREAPTTELAAKTAIMNSKLEGIGSLFSIEVALNLVHAAKASLERAALFAQLEGQSGEESKEQCETIFVYLLQTLGFRHVKPGFDTAVRHLTLYSAREASSHGQSGVRPLVMFLELVNVGDLIQQMLDVFYVQELVNNKLTDRDDFLNSAVKEKKRFEQMLDERVAAGLNKGIDVLMDEVEYLCATTQDAKDFNLSGTGSSGAEDIVLDIGPTKTASRVVELVSSHTGMLVGSTDKNMLDVFNQEVGLRLFNVLCKHIKRQRISVGGAIKLISDTNYYFGYVQTLRNKEILQYFIAIRELSQIFLIDGANAKEIAAIIADGDRYHGIFRAEEVYEFAQRRADWYQIKPSVEKAMYGFGCSVM
ncbi:hypothetical protein MRB53_037681 [Persea americana]|nr:hypothetical protein MRB53_037681 [Persea americana]